MQIFVRATEYIPQAQLAIADYNKVNMVHSARTFSALHEYVVRQIANNTVTAGSHGLAAHAHVTVPGAPINTPGSDTEAIVAGVVAYLALHHPSAAAVNSLAGGTSSGRNGRGNRARTAAPTAYCFIHGYGSHTGGQCFVMAGGSEYTTAMKAATAPCSIGKLVGSRRNEQERK
jgi:hypothetical protein